jgi:uridylate kinase
MSDQAFKRILLKLSGESLMGAQDYGTDPEKVDAIARQIKNVRGLGVEVAVVLGAGNIYRGIAGAAAGMDRATADYLGMIAIVINAVTLQEGLEKMGVHTRVQSALNIAEVAEPYIRRRAMRHLEKGRVVIFAAGTGNPFFTTDTTAALRAVEIDAGVMLRGTHSGGGGIYDADPRTHPDALLLDEISYVEIINQGLQAMDPTAVTLCMENKLPIVVFDLMTPGNVRSILEGNRIGTLVR